MEWAILNEAQGPKSRTIFARSDQPYTPCSSTAGTRQIPLGTNAVFVCVSRVEKYNLWTRAAPLVSILLFSQVMLFPVLSMVTPDASHVIPRKRPDTMRLYDEKSIEAKRCADRDWNSVSKYLTDFPTRESREFPLVTAKKRFSQVVRWEFTTRENTKKRTICIN